MDDLALKQSMYRQILVIFGIRCFKNVSVQFHWNWFIQRCPKTILWTNNVFHSLSKNYFPALLSSLLALSYHVKIPKVNLALFSSWIFLSSHSKQARIKYCACPETENFLQWPEVCKGRLFCSFLWHLARTMNQYLLKRLGWYTKKNTWASLNGIVILPLRNSR